MENLLLPRAHRHQSEILKAESRFRVVACGRRFGKTTLGERAIVKRAAEFGKACWWLSPTYDMADHVWRDLVYAARDLPGVQISQSDLRLDFDNGGWIAIHSTHNPDHLRGAGLDFAVLDEAAFMPPDIWPEIVRPMLVERKGHALFLSTPFGRNWFWGVYQLGISGQEDWRSWHFPTSENPLLDPAELESIRLQTPEYAWTQEYLAEFADSAGQVFRGIRQAATAPLNAQPVPGTRYVVGLDWGRENDYTAIVVIDTERKAVVALDRFNQVNWSLQRGRLKALCDRWQPISIYAESNSIGEPNIEALRAENLPVRSFQTTASSKPKLIDALALAIERGELALLPDENLIGELASYTLERLPSGSYRYSAPPGLHDDLVIALALAWHAAARTDFSFSII